MARHRLTMKPWVMAPLLMLAVGLDARAVATRLTGDDIAYLDVANMIRQGQWRAALSPIWSIGYPLLLNVVRPSFGTSARGELYAVLTLNVLIALATWLAFWWLVRTAAAERHASWYLTLAAAAVFLSAELTLGRVGSAGPDQLVACVFFCASGATLRFIRQPDLRRALLLGLILGCGVWVKAVLLPLGVVLFATAFLAARLRLGRAPREPIAWLARPLLMVLIAAPYWAGLSWALGRPTLGEAAALNYAFHVNGVPHWMGWQGDPHSSSLARRTQLLPAPPAYGLGVPFHPLRLVMNDPPVFVFAEPFAVTYPPHFNLVFWYDGYRRFFSAHNAVRAVLSNLRELRNTFAFFWPTLLISVIASGLVISKRGGWQAALRVWPLYVPSLAGLVMYLTVHVEDRYIEPFVAVLAMLPFVLLAARPARGRTQWCVLGLLLLVLPFETARAWSIRQPVLAMMATHSDGFQNEQWRLASALAASGVKPGDRVASVADGNDIRCGWAYVARVRIVAHLGNDAFDAGEANQLRDLHQFTDEPAVQQRVLQVFRQAGAVAVIAPDLPFAMHAPGWQHVDGTNAWIFMLQ